MSKRKQGDQRAQNATIAQSSDLTDEVLYQQPDLLARIMETSPAGIGVANRQGQIIFANARAEQILGLSRDKITQRTYGASTWQTTKLDGSPVPDNETVFQRVLTTKKPVYNVRRVVQEPIGEHIQISINGAPLFDESGRVTRVVYVIEDVTAQVKTEEMLRQQRDLVTRIMETSPVGIIVVEPDGKIAFANAHAERVLGLSKDEITQRAYNAPEWRITDFDGNPFPDDQLPFEQIMATHQPIYDFRHAIEWPDGRRICLAINGAPLLDESGQIERALFAVEDITQQTQTQEALRHSHKTQESQLHLTQTLQEVGALLTTQMSLDDLFEKLFDLLAQVIDYDSVSVHLLDQDRWTNLRAWRGFPDVEAARRLIKSFDWEKLRERWHSQRYQVISDTRTKEYWVVTPGLEYIRSWVGAALVVKDRLIGELSVDSATLNAYDESAAQTVFAFANQAAIAIENTRLYEEAQREIAERAQAEKALRESEERYRRVSELASDFAYSIRIDRDDNHTLEWMTEAFTRITGYEVDRFRSIEGWRILVHPDDWSIVTEQVQALSSGRSETAKFRILTKNREVRWLSNHGHPVWGETEQRVVRVFGAVRDVTERVRADQVLRQRTAELVARNEELDAFAYTVAHDLKNPLTVTIASAETLLEGLGGKSEAELKRVLWSVIRNGRKMNAIIDSLLALSGVREMSVDPEPVDMAQIVDGVLERLAPMIAHYQAQIDVPNGWPTAIGYAPWLEQVWSNYLTNAFKYGGRPPRIRLGAAPWIENKVRFWVQDNGPGLKPEQQLQLFTPFVRIDEFNDVGHGLGLAIVKRIIEKLDGEVSVESQVGQGSVFSFTLPSG